jgi:iron(III) transport system substrate-binding protein
MRQACGAWVFTVAVAFGILGIARPSAANDSQDRWAKTIAAAKSEGVLSLYGGYNVDYRGYNAVFEKRFPGIRVEFTQGSGNQLAIRIQSERRVNKYLVDVVMGGASTFQGYPDGTFDEMRPMMILPEVADESAWFGGHHAFVDPFGKYVITSQGSLGQELAYNTNLVDPNEIRSWRDLLDPKWRGKILYFNHNSISSTFIFWFNQPNLGPQFISDLFSKAQIKQTQNLRQGIDWLGTGRFAIYLDGTPQAVELAKAKGLPVALFPQMLAEGEVMTGSYCCMGVLNKPPHPSAAKVFVNWVLSRDGQIEWQKISHRNSLRTDIPKDGVPPEIIPQPGVSYFHADLAKYQNAADVRTIKKLIEQLQNE